MTDAPAPADVARAPAREPGAPVPKDEIDPELVNLRPRTQVGLVTALAVVAFCAFLAIRLWPDFEFAGEGKPRTTAVGEIVAGKVAAESHVEVPLALERAAAVRVRRAKGVSGLRVVPAAGGGDALWVVLDGDGWIPPRDGASYTGRLRRLSGLPFAAALRAEVRAHPAPRHVTSDELRRAKGAGGALTAVTGDSFDVAADDVVEIVVPDPDEVTVVASFDSFRPDVAAYTKALADAGLVAPGAQPLRADAQQAWFDVKRPGALASTDAALVSAHAYSARVEPLIRRHRAAWGALAVDADGVTVEGARIPWGTFKVAAVHTARPLPGDPWVLIVGDAPDQYWYVRPLYVAIGLFAALFTWALVRTARRELFAPKVPTRA